MNRETIEVAKFEAGKETRKKGNEIKQAGGQTLIHNPKKTAHAQQIARARQKVRRRSHTTRSHVRRRNKTHVMGQTCEPHDHNNVVHPASVLPLSSGHVNQGRRRPISMPTCPCMACKK
jgi:hypothetical protein